MFTKTYDLVNTLSASLPGPEGVFANKGIRLLLVHGKSISLFNGMNHFGPAQWREAVCGVREGHKT